MPMKKRIQPTAKKAIASKKVLKKDQASKTAQSKKTPEKKVTSKRAGEDSKKMLPVKAINKKTVQSKKKAPENTDRSNVSSKSNAELEKADKNKRRSKPFPIVGIGASAGGLEALKEFLKYLPADTGMSYIYIQHLSPTHESMLSSILSRATKMPVIEAVSKMIIKPNHLYIIPPNKDMSIMDGVLKLSPRSEKQNVHLPVNNFFLSLADKQKEGAIGVILSGNGSDGSTGLKAIKIAGGITFAQDETAKFQGMPKSAISEGSVDMVLSPREIAQELERISRKANALYAIRNANEDALMEESGEDIDSILRLLRKSTGVDFNLYKKNTIVRRMLLHKLDTLKEYAQYMRQHTEEINVLYNDLLINVTCFFRDNDTFEYLKKNILPKLIKTKSASDPIRIWVPACSTGEEVYSLAMLISDTFGEKAALIPIQLFGTDLSEKAIAKARLGIYSKNYIADVPPRMLERYFTKLDGSYRIIKPIRDLCVFAQHNVLHDPPFSRMDIISCCNLMIYIDNSYQKKLLATYHYSLNPGGYLVLGKSESIQGSANLFSPVDKKVKIYQRKDTNTKMIFDQSYIIPETKYPVLRAVQRNNHGQADGKDIEKAIDNLLISKYLPPSVVVNEDLDIIQFRGSTGTFLEPASGRASLNLMKMAKGGLAFELRRAVFKVSKSGKPVQKSGISIDNNGGRYLDFEVAPLPFKDEQKYFIVLFQEAMAAPSNTSVLSRDKTIRQLQNELNTSREDMRTMIEEQQAVNEELQSANEEIVSSNEELQSINEELETSKEEVESTNEELMTINSELQIRNEQLNESYEYAEMLLNTIRESAMILDSDLRIKTVNKTFLTTFDLKEEDVEGNIIFELDEGRWNLESLHNLLEDILHRTPQTINYRIQDNFPRVGEKVIVISAQRINRTSHSQLLIVLAISDITEFVMAEKIIEEREAWYLQTLESIPSIAFSFSADGKLIYMNKRWTEYTDMSDKDTFNEHLRMNVLHKDDQQLYAEKLQMGLKNGKPMEGEYRYRNAEGEYRWHLFKAMPVSESGDKITSWTATVTDIHEQHLYTEALKESAEKIRAVLEGLPQMAWTMDAQGNINFVNKEYSNYTGVDNNSLENYVPKKLMHPHDASRFEVLLSEHVKKGKALVTELRLKRMSDGEYRWHHVRITPICDVRGIVTSWVGTKTDIHDQKMFMTELEERVHERTEMLTESNRNLRQSNSELEQFAFVAGHDLQEPLRKIMTFSSRIQQRFHDNKIEDVKMYLDKITESSERMSKLINDLLDFSRFIRNERMFEPVALHTLAKEVIGDFGKIIQQHHAKVTLKKLPEIDGIPVQMKQLFHNLLSNALKFSADAQHSLITISGKTIKHTDMPKEFTPDDSKNYIEVIIDDNGIGFDQRFAEQIFEIFQRLHDKQTFPGTGIGLALCRKIVTNHNGYIYAKSEKGKGASFRVILPITHK
jgi:two-component system CheB/CheR fusion protein